MKSRGLVAFIFCLLLCVGVTFAQPEPKFEPDICPFRLSEDYPVDCGYLRVPEDRDEADSDLIALAVAILRSSNPNKAPDPLIYLEGGPGGSALSDVSSWFQSPFLENRDIILIDQRGTGYSRPYLGCYVDEDVSEESVDYARLCHEDLIAQGIRLNAYTSRENAADIADLRVALGYDEVNLLGISYGTRLALTVMRDHPQGIRSVILDSVYPPDAMGQNEQAFNFYMALKQMFTDCAADSACASAYPELETMLFNLVDAANENPIEVDGEFYSGDDLLDLLFQALYDTNIIPYLPALIARTVDGDKELLRALLAEELGYSEEEYTEGYSDPAYDLYLEMLAEYLDVEDTDEVLAYFDEISEEDYYTLNEAFIYEEMSDDQFDTLLMVFMGYEDLDSLYADLDAMQEDKQDDLYDQMITFLIEGIEDLSDSEGMFYSVECYDEVAFNSIEAVAALSAGLPVQVQVMILASIETDFAVCALWTVDVPDPIETQPVVSDIPTLIFSGNYDPITPPAWGIRAAQSLSNSRHYEFSGVGHSVIDSGDCALQIARGFINAPQNEPNAACIQDIRPPAFVIGD